MDDSEKMNALKKAYAEIILNTAKEAAGRVMVAERRAHQLQYDLQFTKDEALRLLFRLKNTMDDKMKEEEMKSSNQERRIEELEAQLQEAEDIVGNLRAELNYAHLKLEEAAKSQLQSDFHLIQEIGVLNDRGAPPEKVMPEVIAVPQARWHNKAANGHFVPNHYLEEYKYTAVPDVPSIISRSKERELYRNGCTQRIRACEGNLLKGHYSISTESDSLKERMHVTPVAAIPPVEDFPVSVTETKNGDINISNGLSIFRKRRRRGTRYGRSVASALVPVCPVSAKDSLLDLSNSQTNLTLSFGLERIDEKDESTESLSPTTTPSDVLEKDRLTEQTVFFEGENELTEAGDRDGDDGREVASSLAMIRQHSGSGDCLDAPGSNYNLDLKNVSSVSSRTVDPFSSPPPKDRVLKYTFQRKRKKESISSDSSWLLQDNPLETKLGKENCSVDPSTSSTAAESSRDNRRMAQVARQLICLSEKKWSS